MIRRNSRQRQLILDVMRGEGIHMNADQVYQKVKQADPSIGIATVYRNLNLLTEMGEIQKFQDRSAGFMSEKASSLLLSILQAVFRRFVLRGGADDPPS